MWRIILVAILVGGIAAAGCSGGGSELTAKEEFAQLAERHRGATFAATYEWSSTGNPVMGDQTGFVDWYQQADRGRIDMEKLERGHYTLIIREDRSFECTTYPNRVSGVPGCVVELPNSEALFHAQSPITRFWNEIHHPGDVFAVVKTGKRTVADRRAECFAIEAHQAGVEKELCLSNDGLFLFSLLRNEESGITMTLQATSASVDVPQGIFEPPYEIVGESEACQHDAIEC